MIRSALFIAVVTGLGFIIADQAAYRWRASANLPAVCQHCRGDCSTFRGVPFCPRCEPAPWKHLLERKDQ